MRSELIRVYVPKHSSRVCKFCCALGYVVESDDAREDQLDVFSTMSYSNSLVVVVHVAGIHCKEYSQLSKHLAKTQTVKLIGCLDCYQKNFEVVLNHLNFALVLKNESELHYSLVRYSEPQIYFYVQADSFDRHILADLSAKDRSRVHLFSSFDSGKDIDGNQQAKLLKIGYELEKQGIEFQYDLPFSHDLIDNRKANHLQWVFAPNLMYKSQFFSESEIQISIVIPFNNRAKFVLKVLAAIELQHLDKRKFEVILLDDGSEVEDSNMLKSHFVSRFGSLNLSYHYIERVSKLSSTYIDNRVGPIRNLGAHVAVGRTLLFLDSDILLPKNYLDGILNIHRDYDVVLPRRKYLNKSASNISDGTSLSFSSAEIMETPWNIFLNEIFKHEAWQDSIFPWKYFLTYCLSIDKELFLKTGGFRTSFISYGYEDLDLGFRVLKFSPRLYLFQKDVFHLFHFNKESEYDLVSFSRYFQLTMSARTFVMQNLPSGSHDLEKMIQFRSVMARIFYFLSFWRRFI